MTYRDATHLKIGYQLLFLQPTCISMASSLSPETIIASTASIVGGSLFSIDKRCRIRSKLFEPISDNMGESVKG